VSGAKTSSCLELLESLQSRIVAKIEEELQSTLRQMQFLFSEPRSQVNYRSLYHILVGSEKSRWNLLIQHGLYELKYLLQYEHTNFTISGCFMEYPVSRISERPATEK
jgi:hypothetical protein